MAYGGRGRAAALVAVLAAVAVAGGCGKTDGGKGKGSQSRASGKLAVRPGAQGPQVGVVAGSDDVEAANASPLPKGFKPTKHAPQPGKVAVKASKSQARKNDDGPAISPGAPSDDEIAAELKQMKHVQEQAKRAAKHARPFAPLDLTGKGNAQTPSNAPEAVAEIIAGANAIARFPYVYGGGHGSFVDTAYDCSGSVSYALATAGLLTSPLTSGDLAHWGAPGPGRWVTIYANAGHTFMFVAGTRFDTSGRSGVHGSRWQPGSRNVGGFKVRHPPGL